MLLLLLLIRNRYKLQTFLMLAIVSVQYRHVKNDPIILQNLFITNPKLGAHEILNFHDSVIVGDSMAP